jgi:5-methylcytosine-specific restriction endonuclease McrA
LVMETKVCRVCGQEKPIDQFRRYYKHKTDIKLYYRRDCICCERAYSRKHNPAYYAANAERLKEEERERRRSGRPRDRRRERYATEPEYKTKHLNRMKELRSTPRWKDHQLSYNHRYRTENGDRLRQYDRERRELPGRKAQELQAGHAKRAAKRNTAIEDLTDYILSIRSSETVECYWCGDVIPGSKCDLDHVIPLSKGGTHTRDNLVPACEHCNEMKHDKMPEEFLAARRKLGLKINEQRIEQQ